LTFHFHFPSDCKINGIGGIASYLFTLCFEFLPAPGFRSYASGELVNIGKYGFSWSAATSGVAGLDLSFSSQTLNTRTADHRGHGFQLRCLSE